MILTASSAPHWAKPAISLKDNGFTSLSSSRLRKRIPSTLLRLFLLLKAAGTSNSWSKMTPKILEKDWYAEAGILSRIFESVRSNNEMPSSADIHAFLDFGFQWHVSLLSQQCDDDYTAIILGVGRYSIISQPSAIDMLIAICRGGVRIRK